MTANTGDMILTNELKKVWEISNLTRNIQGSYEYHFTLLLVFCEAYHPLEIENLSKKGLQYCLEMILNQNHSTFQNDIHSKDVIEVLYPSGLDSSDAVLTNVYKALKKLDNEYLEKNLPKLFNSFLNQVFSTKRLPFSGIIIPDELANILTNFIDGAKTIYNPYAGHFQLAENLYDEAEVTAQESNKTLWALGVLRSIMSRKSVKFSYSNPVSNWPKSEKFEAIVSVPPFSKKLSSRERINSNIKNVEQFLLSNGLDNLTSKGRLVAVLPIGFLFKGGYDKKIREMLVEKDLLDTVITFPGGVLKQTTIKVCIIVIDKAKNHSGKFRLITADNYCDSKTNVIDSEGFLNSLSEFNNSNNVKIVDKEEVVDNSYNLSVQRYFVKNIEGVELKKILEPISRKVSVKGKSKIVRIQNLSSSIEKPFLNTYQLENDFNEGRYAEIEDRSLLISTHGDNLKPTFYNKTTDESLYASSNINVFRVNEKIVDIIYLINTLSGEDVKKSVKLMQQGSAIPRLRLADFLNLKIDIPSIEIQLSINKKIQESVQQSSIMQNQLTSEIQKTKESFEAELKEKQHTIRQYLKNIKDSIDVLYKFHDQNESVKLSDVINPNRKSTVSDRFKGVEKSIELLINEVNNLDTDIVFKIPEELSIVDLLNFAVDQFPKSELYDFQIDIDEYSLKDAKIMDPKVLISRVDFIEMFNNIIWNARNHGFTEDKKYTIKIVISISNEKVVLEILNNGKPFPQGVSEDFGVKGTKAGINANTGIGVWKVIQIAKHFNLRYQIIDEPKSMFPVGWRFKFQIQNYGND